MVTRFLAVLVASWICLGASAFAQDEADKAQAREQFNRGIAEYEAGHYEPALEAFQEAYRLSPHPMVRVNMANCYDRLSKPVEAMFHFERFLTETVGDRSRAEQRTEVEAALKRLKNSVGELNLRVIPDGSLVSIDETEERRSPIMESIRVAAGDHVITIRKQGFATEERRVVVRGGATETLNVTLEHAEVVAAVEPGPTATPPITGDVRPQIQPLPEGEPDPEFDEPEPAVAEVRLSVEPLPSLPAGERSIFTPPVIIAGVISGTCLLGSMLVGIAALSANSDFDSLSARSRNPAVGMIERAEARDAARAAGDRANSRALTADILFAGALISGAAAVVFVLMQDDQTEDPDLALRFGPNGAALAGTF